MNKDLEILLNPRIHMPKMYSFDETRELVKLAKQEGREEVKKEISARISEVEKYIQTSVSGFEKAGLVLLKDSLIEIKETFKNKS